MPVNTREKRSSAQALLVPSYTPGVAPSAMDQAARQASVWIYAGILAAPPGGAVGHPATRRLGRAGTVRPEMRDGREGVFIFDQPSMAGVAVYKLLDVLVEGQVLRAYRRPRRAAKRHSLSVARSWAHRRAQGG